MPQTESVTAQKSALRRAVRERARALSPEYRAGASVKICKQLLSLPELPGQGAVLAFSPTAAEPDIAPAIERLLAEGVPLALPRCVAPGVMEFRRVESLDRLVPGAYGLLEPPEGAPLVPREELSFAIIPCVAADRRGGRLGHGGGYYDRFLARAPGRMTAAMVCFAALLEEAIPMGELDIHIPLVITEEGVWREGVLRP